MVKKIFIGTSSAVLFVVMAWSWYSSVYMKEKHETQAAVQKAVEEVKAAEKHVVPQGTYAIVQNESVIRWSLGKPLLPDYFTSGLFNVGSGTIQVGEGTTSAAFSINMETLQIGRITEEGKEGVFKSALEGKDFFDIAHYPSSEFVITEVLPQADSAQTFLYRVRGSLTMKGKTNELMFPAKIYEKGGKLYTEASFDLNRTLWGITASSSSVVADIGDEAVGDTVPLTLSVVASPR